MIVHFDEQPRQTTIFDRIYYVVSNKSPIIFHQLLAKILKLNNRSLVLA